MGYYTKRGRVPRGSSLDGLLGALGSSSCGAGQTYRSNVTYAGRKGQCMTDAQYEQCKATGQYGGQPCNVAPTLAETVTGILTVFAPTPAQVAPVVVPSGGMSTTTKLAIAAGAVGLVAVLALRK